MLMGLREYGRHRGVSLQAVQKAIRAGRILANADKKIDSDEADRAWAANTDSSRIAVNAIDNRPPDFTPGLQLEIMTGPAVQPAASATPAEGDELVGSDRTASKYREHRADRERYNALKQKIEYEQLVGQLINVEDAKRIAYTSFRAIRDSIMNVAVRIKDQLAAETDPHACEMLVEAELMAALSGIDVGNLLQEKDEEE